MWASQQLPQRLGPTIVQPHNFMANAQQRWSVKSFKMVVLASEAHVVNLSVSEMNTTVA
jgi:hypothetical protein